MATVSETGMEKAEMRQLLGRSTEDNSVRCGIALHKDSRLAYLKLSKMGMAQALSAELRKEHAEIKAVTWGTVIPGDVDSRPESTHDAKMAVFRLEKRLSGLAKRLRGTLKGTGFAKIMIIYGDGSTDSELQDDDADGSDTGSPEGAPVADAPAPLTPPALPPQPPELAALLRRLTSLSLRIPAMPEVLQASLKHLATEAGGKLKEADLVAAKVFIDELEAALAQTVPAAPANAATQFAARLKLVKPALDRAMLEPGEASGASKALAIEMAGAARGGDFANASEILARIEALLAGGPASETLVPEATASPAEKAALRQRLATLTPDLRRAQALDETMFADIRAQLAEVQRLGDAGQADAALDMMDDVELALVAALPPSNVSFQKMRLRWEDGKKQVAAQLAALQAAVTSDAAGGPDDTGVAAQRLNEVLEVFNEGLTDTLDRFTNAEVGPDRLALREASVPIVEHYIDFVQTSPLIRHIESNPFIPVTVRLTLMQPLQMLEIELAKGGA